MLWNDATQLLEMGAAIALAIAALNIYIWIVKGGRTQGSRT